MQHTVGKRITRSPWHRLCDAYTTSWPDSIENVYHLQGQDVGQMSWNGGLAFHYVCVFTFKWEHSVVKFLPSTTVSSKVVGIQVPLCWRQSSQFNFQAVSMTTCVHYFLLKFANFKRWTPESCYLPSRGVAPQTIVGRAWTCKRRRFNQLGKRDKHPKSHLRQKLTSADFWMESVLIFLKLFLNDVLCLRLMVTRLIFECNVLHIRMVNKL